MRYLSLVATLQGRMAAGLLGWPTNVLARYGDKASETKEQRDFIARYAAEIKREELGRQASLNA